MGRGRQQIVCIRCVIYLPGEAQLRGSIWFSACFQALVLAYIPSGTSETKEAGCRGWRRNLWPGPSPVFFRIPGLWVLSGSGGIPSALEKAEEDHRTPPSEPSMAPPDVWKGGSWAAGTQSQLESHPTAPLCQQLGLGSGAPGSCCL